MKNKRIFNFVTFFILFTSLEVVFSLIVLPIKTIENNKEENPFIISNNIVSNIFIGDPEQLIDFFYTTGTSNFLFDDEHCLGNNFYKKNLSSINITKMEEILIDEEEKAILLNETLYFYKDLNLKQKVTIKNFPILIKKAQIHSQKLCLLAGLLFKTHGPYKIYNLIEQLKKKSVIESYYWTIKYTSEEEGLFIIGNEPHKYDPKNYNESHWRTINPTIIDNAYGWTINFDKVYNGDILVSGKKSFCLISQGNKYIMGDHNYNKSIAENFFNTYINKRICFYFHNAYAQSYYYCDKKSFSKNDIKKFPLLTFINVDFEEKFTFSGEELFFEGKDYYYFKIYFNDFSPNWLIGKIFLKKYQFVFNHDQKLIGYYKINNTNGEEDSGGSSFFPNIKNKYLYFIIGGAALIVIAIVTILLIKFYFKPSCCGGKHRKKLVNELVDEDDFPNNNDDNTNETNSEKKNKDQLLDMNF